MSKGWKNESRRHSLARKGVKTNVDESRRFDVSTFVAKGMVHGYDIDEIYNGFIEAMLWATQDPDHKDEVFLENNYSIYDVDKDTARAIKFLIEDFMNENHELFEEIEINEGIRISEEMIGNDLFLDTQGHGVGFWSRDYGLNGKLLSKEAKKFFDDSMYAYAGDDGKIYFEGVTKLKASGRSKFTIVRDLMRKEGVDPEYASPNFVKDFADNRGIKLTSEQVVDISNRYTSSGEYKQKKWEVVMISPHGRTAIEEVTLGRKSNKFDVIQSLKRQGIKGEIIQIKELKASGVSADVSRIKRNLINKAKKRGIYENFGQVEINRLRDKYSDYRYGSEEQRKQWANIEALDEWAMNYTG